MTSFFSADVPPARLTFTRRAAVASAAAAALALAGCGRRAPEVELADADEALGFTLGALAERHGEEFSAIHAYEGVAEDGRRAYPFVLEPSSGGDRPFNAAVWVDEQTCALMEGPLTNYPQYLFKERAEGPFLEALAGCAGIAGYAATLMKVHFDDRVWREGDFEAYMGDAGMWDPCVQCMVMLPRGGGARAWAEAFRGAMLALYPLERSMSFYVAEEGRDPFRDALWAFNPDYAYPATRKPVPDVGYLEEDFAGGIALGFDTSWDGEPLARGEALAEDEPLVPSDRTYLPRITWNPGHGPSSW